MIFPEPRDFVKFPKDMAPQLIVVVDVEEEFDWSKPFSRNETGVTNVNELWRVQEIFDRHGVIPTYAVDYPVASTPSSVKVIREILEVGRCEIGAQLHPWVNPPYDEELTVFHSYAGNLPENLEFEKLRILTETIERNFGQRPTTYRAGRYGFGPNTTKILEKLGYLVDVSTVPYTSFAAEGGPDYRQHTPQPYWFGTQGKILEIPVTCSFSGVLADKIQGIFPFIDSALGEALKVKSAFARLNIIDRVRLSPEGMTLKEMTRVSEKLHRNNAKIFQLSFHSSSLKAGCTEYARDEAERDRFLERLEAYLAQSTITPMRLSLARQMCSRPSLDAHSPSTSVLRSADQSTHQTGGIIESGYNTANIIWAVGMPRSGTSWIGKILDSHPDTLYRHEPDTELKPGDEFSLLKPISQGTDPSDPKKYLHQVLEARSERICGKLPTFPKSYYSPSAYLMKNAALYTYKALFRLGLSIPMPEFVNRHRRSDVRLVWKSINSTGSLGAFAELLPGCNIVHIVRHPCGHASSVLTGEHLKKFASETQASEDLGIYRSLSDTTNAKKHGLTFASFQEMTPIERIAWRWTLINEKAFEEGQHIGNYTLLYYDQFCADPLENAKALLKALDLKWNNSVETFLQESIGTDNDAYYSLTKDPLTAANKWRQQLTDAEIETVLNIANQSTFGRKLLDSPQLNSLSDDLSTKNG